MAVFNRQFQLSSNFRSCIPVFVWLRFCFWWHLKDNVSFDCLKILLFFQFHSKMKLFVTKFEMIKLTDFAVSQQSVKEPTKTLYSWCTTLWSSINHQIRYLWNFHNVFRKIVGNISKWIVSNIFFSSLFQMNEERFVSNWWKIFDSISCPKLFIF